MRLAASMICRGFLMPPESSSLPRCSAVDTMIRTLDPVPRRPARPHTPAGVSRVVEAAE